ncbi:MAG: MFS transporter [Thermomicrobiales bacterium]|nr:MFS transporter [Thermomicrobiales bacterium]
MARFRFPRPGKRASDGEGSGEPGLFSAFKRYPAFRQLWFGSVTANVAQWMQGIALGWIALDLSDSAFFVGLVSFAAGIPFLIVGVPAGVLIDRYDRRIVLLVGQAIAATVAVIVAVDIIAGWVEPWHLLVAAFLNGSMLAVMSPAQQALTPSLVEREDLRTAIGLTAAGHNLARIFGPSLAGVIIGLWGTGFAFSLQAIALFASMAIILRGKFPKSAHADVTVRTGGPLEGLKYVLRRPDLRFLFALVFIPAFFLIPYISFLNVFAVDTLNVDASALGIMMAFQGVGAMAGSLFIASRKQTANLGRFLIGFSFLYALTLLATSLVRYFPLALFTLFAGSLVGSIFMAQNNVSVLHRVDDAVRGRVLGAYVLNQGLMPIGALPMGFVAGIWGVPVSYALGAVLTAIFLSLVIIRTNPLWREI